MQWFVSGTMIFNKTKQLTSFFSSFGMEFMWVILAQVFTLLGSLAVIKILSNLLNEFQFGVYSLSISISSLLVAMLFLPLGQVYMRFLAVVENSSLYNKLYNNQNYHLIIVSLISLLIIFPSTLLISRYTDNYFATFAALTFLTIALGYQAVQQFLLMTFRLRVAGSVVQMIGAVVRPFFVFMAIWLLGGEALPAILGVLLGFAIISLSQYVVLNNYRKNGKAKELPEYVENSEDIVLPRKYLSYGAFHLVLGIVSVVILSSDRWLLSVLGTIDQVAVYAALMQIALAPTAFAYAIVTRFAAPIYFASRQLPVAEQNRRFWMVLILWFVICAVVLFITIMFHNFIVEILTQKNFAQYSYLLPWMVLGFLFERSAQILGLKGALMLKTGMYLYNYFILILLVPLLEYIFFMILGFDGIVFGLVLATTISFCCIALLNKIFL